MFLDVEKKYELSDTLFWDTNPNSVNPKTHALAIIERVLTRGKLEEFRHLVAFYGRNEIRNEIKNIQYLDEITMYYGHHIFQIPLEELTCYTLRQSLPKRGDY